MKVANDNKGITLVALAITIIVLSLVTFTIVSTGINNVKNAVFSKVKAEMEIMQSQVNGWYEIYKNGDNSVLNYGDAVSNADYTKYQNAFNADVSVEQAEAIEDYRMFSAEYITKTLDIDGIEDDFLISIKNRDVRLANGIDYQDKLYYTAQDFEIFNVNRQSSSITSTFTLAGETDSNNIYIQDLSFKDNNNNSVNINKFKIEYRLQGETNWSRKKISDSNIEKISYNEKDSYVINVKKSGTYEIRIADTSGMVLSNVETCTRTVRTTVSIMANMVSFTPEDTNWTVDNVQDALDDLFDE